MDDPPQAAYEFKGLISIPRINPLTGTQVNMNCQQMRFTPNNYTFLKLVIIYLQIKLQEEKITIMLSYTCTHWY